MSIKCAWPDCGAQTDNWLEDGWCTYGGGDPTEGGYPDMPEDGYWCLHHKEAVEAFYEGDFERFLLLTSI